MDRNNKHWLRGAQVALALGYKNPDNAIKDLYTRNAAEFTDSMTALVKLPTAGGEQETRIFSLRGAHLLGMFARITKAAEFRRWVLDILDKEIQPVSLPYYITAAQAGELATLIAERFPEGRHRPYAWSRFNNHFRLSGYKTLPADKFDEACDYIKTLPGKEAADPLEAAAMSALKGTRWMMTFDIVTQQPKLTRIAADAHIVSLGDIAELVAMKGYALVPQAAIDMLKGAA